MKYYPAFLNLKGKLCLVAGGGQVAERKVQGLLRAGALVKVVSPQLTPQLSKLKEQGKIICHLRSYRAQDLKGAYLAIAATNERKTNEKIYFQALAQRIPVNVVDDPEHSSFIVPSLVKRGDIVLAISTSGKSPAMARFLRQKLQKDIGPEYAYLVKFLGALRPWLLGHIKGSKNHQRIFRLLASENSLQLIRQKKFQELEAHCQTLLGPGFSFKSLRLSR